jgi:hypothetical protein
MSIAAHSIGQTAKESFINVKTVHAVWRESAAMLS